MLRWNVSVGFYVFEGLEFKALGLGFRNLDLCEKMAGSELRMVFECRLQEVLG